MVGVRLRRRAGAAARRAAAEALSAEGRRRHAALLRLRRRGGGAARDRRPHARVVPAGLALARGPPHAARRRRGAGAARVARAGEAPLRAALRGGTPARLGQHPGNRPAGGEMRRPTALAKVDEQIRRLLDLSHPDPHSVLGMHPDGDGVVVRTFRPDAEQVTVLPDFGGRVPAVHRRGGVFEARLNNRHELFGYLIEVRYAGGATFTLRDPYSFPPTLGELDSHLAAEGRHERLWERLGAHPAHHRGTYGTSFAVWAPTARSVSVVGDSNSWDERRHPMPALGSTRILELFVPEVGPGTRYKFEVRPGSGGPRLLKADPYAFRTEPPPATASVVHDLTRYRWHDAEWMSARASLDLRRQ